MKPLLPLLALCGLPVASHATTTYCVHDAQELYAVLGAAQNSLDTPVLVNLRKGTYDAGDANGAFGLIQGHGNQLVAISGGWSGDNGACTKHGYGAADTVLVGNSIRRTLNLATSNAGPNTGNMLYLSDLTLRNPFGTGYSSCLNAQVTADSSFTMERVHIDECISQGSSLDTTVSFITKGGQFTIDNLVVRRSSAEFNGGISANATNGGTIRMTQLSITGNDASIDSPTVKATGLLLYADNNGSRIDVGNSVVWGNVTDWDTSDINVTGPNIHLTRVHYGSLGGAPASNDTPGTGDPGFIAADDPHLRADSILIDTGVSGPEGGSGLTDIEGRARSLGAAIDVGAYEWSETIFKNGFD